jgi:hypothetical protein
MYTCIYVTFVFLLTAMVKTNKHSCMGRTSCMSMGWWCFKRWYNRNGGEIVIVLRIMGPSGTTYSPTNSCFRELALWKNPTKRANLVQRKHHHPIDMQLVLPIQECSSWYSWKILALSKNYLHTINNDIIFSACSWYHL